MKQERRQNEWHNRVERLQKPDGLSEARDSSHGFFTGLLTYANEHNMPDIAGYTIQQIQKEKHLTQNFISDKIAGRKSPLFLCKKSGILEMKKGGRNIWQL